MFQRSSYSSSLLNGRTGLLLLFRRCLGFIILFGCLGLGTITAAQAQTVLSGIYDNSPNPPGDGDGYDARITATSDSYLVNAGASFSHNGEEGLLANVPIMTVNGGTFSNNHDDGLAAQDTTMTVNGGTFSHNANNGLVDTDNSAVTVNGGTFSNNTNNGLDVGISDLIVNGGTFSNNGLAGLHAGDSTVTVNGGTFSGNTVADLSANSGSIDVYGTFDGLSAGQTETLVCTSAVQSFHGQLLYAGAPQTFTYTCEGNAGTVGTIILHDVGPPGGPGTLTLYDGGYYATHVDLSDSATGRVNSATSATLATDTHICTGAVADGATKVLLSYNANTAGTVTFTETNGVTGDNLRMVNSTGAPTSVATQVINGQNVAFAVYTVPESLDSTPEAVPSHATKHPVYFQAVFTPTGGTAEPTATGSLVLQSPPVLLVHGLLSDPSTWQQVSGTLACLESGGFDVSLVNYASTHSASLDANRYVLFSNPGGIGRVETKYRSNGIAITKVDVVGHSMGGLVAREYASDYSYYSISNYHSGYVRRLITMGTPHYGSGLASAMTKLALKISVKGYPVGKFIYGYLATCGYEDHGAFLDLATGSSALAALQQIPIPSYAEVGTYTDGYSGSSYLSVIHDILLLFGDSTDAFNGATNDLLVSDSSQEGGLVFPSYHEAMGISHVQETGSGDIGSDVAFRLSDALSFTAFDLNGFPVPQAESLSSASLASASKSSASQDSPTFLSITTPTAGQVFHPGDTVTVTVTPNAGTILQAALITVGAGAQMAGSSLVSQAPFTASFTVPASNLGSLPINVLATDTSGNACIVSANAVVQTSATVSSLSAAAAQVAPSGAALLTSQGSANALTVTGTFSDGVQRDITLGALGTTYVSSDPTIATVSADGLITAVANGNCTITVTNGSASATENVIVQLGTPSILSVAPSSAAPGATVSLALTGTDFGGASQVQFLLKGIPDPNITVTNIQTDLPGQNLTATVTLGATAAPGLRTVVVTTPGGSSDPLAAPDATGFTITSPPSATTTRLASGLNPSASGQSVTFTANVIGGIGTPTGAVTFMVDGAAQTPVTLDGSGNAMLMTSTLTVGSHSITAAYSGDGTYAPSASSTLTQTVTKVTVTVTVAPASGFSGQTVILNATLTATSGGGLSGKTLAFSVDGVVAGTAVTTNTGAASLTYAIAASANTGSHAIAVLFTEDSADQAASGTGTLTVSTPVPVEQVRYFPRVGKESRMFGGQFQGSSDNAHWTTLYTVTSTPTDAYTTAALSVDPATFRYLRYLAPNGSYGNVADIEFDSHGVKLTGTGFGTAGSYNNNGNTFAKALDGSTSTFFDAPAPGNGDFVGIDRGTLTYTKLSGTAFGTAGSYNNDGKTFLNVFDGNLGTYFDAPAPGNGDFAGIDPGAGHAAVVTRIGYCPRPGYASRMVGGVFQGSNDNAAWTALYTVTAAPPTGVLTQTIAISNGTAYRYLRYLAPNGSYGNVAEVEFDTSP